LLLLLLGKGKGNGTCQQLRLNFEPFLLRTPAILERLNSFNFDLGKKFLKKNLYLLLLPVLLVYRRQNRLKPVPDTDK
jgi:hypothetical protein